MPLPDRSVPLSIVIPSFNEKDNVKDVVLESIETLKSLSDHYDVVVVDDESQDGSWAILQQLATEIPELTIIRNEHNMGCHPSSLVGFRAAKGEYRYFIPADRQIPAAEMTKFLDAACGADGQPKCDVVYSWRTNRADPLHRVLVSQFYNLLMRLFFGIKVHDVDSSSLLTRRGVEELLPIIRSDSAFITVEILIEASKRGMGIAEVVIEHRPRLYGTGHELTLHHLGNVPLNFFNMLIWFWKQKLKD